MAEHKIKSQAEKAANAANAKKVKNGNKTKNAKAGKNQAAAGKPVKEDRVRKIPARVISSVSFLAVFIVLLVLILKPEGAIVKLLDVLYGLLGKVGLYVSIPAFLYLFVIHAFSGKRPVIMRTVCLFVFILLCGCISHLAMDPDNLLSVNAFYTGGINGTSGGLICGLIAKVFRWACGPILPYIIFITAAVITLLGGMQITIPSIIRAIQNRPRADWEEEVEERPEPAAVLVNHIATKRIEHIENRRNQAAENAAQSETQANQKAAEIMRQIDSDVETPVAAAAVSETKTQSSKLAPDVDDVPVVMPPFETEAFPEPEILPEPVKEIKPEKVTAKEAMESAIEVAQEIEDAAAAPAQNYCFPPIDLLKLPTDGGADGTAEMRENSRRLNETLASFKIEAHIINVTRGPSVTRYEVELEKGVRLSKLTTAADDIALSLGASGVRIAAVPGKISVVGIEVPNIAVTTVSLREVIDSQDFTKARSKSSFAVGKDIGGNCIVGNISKLPHMLIAGTTGSGKSVCMNSIIISLLYKASPDDVKLIMVDPKMVELGIYNGIPHLLIPVVTDPKKAAGSLQWAVSEMMRRYKAMSDAGVRDLESYNGIVETQEGAGTKLPQVVVIIDELADLMLVAAKEVEESICRIAQMGRAAGIHLIIATQRPSADVITGLMKANIPSRIAFAVASAMESRIILDTQGAEKLVGKGDMLYAPIGSGKPKRVQGCFVSDPEVEAVASYVKANFTTNYDQQVLEEIERKAAQTGNKPTASDPEPSADELGGDEMLPAAVDVILETGQASVSMLQRRLKLGYARAARIVDEMEEKGIVGPFQGSKPRAILITKEQWETMRSGQSAQMDFDDLEEDIEETEDF